MKCIKTGARVHFLNYGVTAPCDIFQVGDTRVIKAPDDVRSYRCTYGPDDVTHYAVVDFGFQTDDYRVFVVESQHLQEIRQLG